MPATNYKVWSWGTPVGMGVSNAVHIGIAGIAKKATQDVPFAVANELICNSLARLLVLPCPPGATIDSEGENYFFSLNFNLAEQSLPPADADEIVRTDPRLAWGIILFDCLIMNPDRHTGNIYHDNSTNRVQIFDHERAFMQSGRTNVTDILNDLNENLGIGGHCLAQKITDIDGQEMWLERISKIPDFFIEEVIESATRVGLPKGSKSDCIDFMKNRRSKIETLMQKQANLFPNIRRNEII